MLYLVPEISLTTQLLSKIINRFGRRRLAVIHSFISREEKLCFWRKIQRGEADIILGARSAVFAPASRLGLIIVDEENDASYKSGQTPRYHARQVAFIRARREKALLLLGSATPSVETYYQARRNRFKMFVLGERYNKMPLPRFTVIDLKQTPEFSKKYPLSALLAGKIDRYLKSGQQALLFINRRGFSNYIICRSCGHIFTCPNCRISLTYHRNPDRLVCHYCGYKAEMAAQCPLCRSIDLTHQGAGTQKVEDILRTVFPASRVERLDTDVSRRKGVMDGIIRDFAKNRIHILTGTQIISKGLNFPFVALSGILFLDDILNIPDFRSAENVFDLIIQVSGRAGRDRRAGEVVIQTSLPEHFAIRHAVRYEFEEFYAEELKLRKELHYPPFYRLVKITLEGKVLSEVEKVSEQVSDGLCRQLKDAEDVEVLGPVPAPLSRIKGKYRYQILIKAVRFKGLKDALKDLKRKEGNVQIIIDADPVSLL